MASAGSDAAAPAQRRKKLTILDLPAETQKEIVSHCSQADLVCLAIVSRHFRDLAAAQLYRNFHIVFPDEDDPQFESPIDGLAGGLDTFVTSEYDYARHLKDMSLDTLSAGEKAETAYKPYLYSASCGKFMNTLLLLTLRKARALESFKWNIRVELSRPVYKALHDIGPLTKLHLRMQVGASLYESPPPLPNATTPNPTVPTSQWDSSALLQQPSSSATIPPLAAGGVAYLGPAAPLPLAHAPPAKTLLAKKKKPVKEPPTLSGFKKLKTLAVLDVDTLDLVPELKKCVRNSQSTLTKLKLSFSDSLAMQSRKPPPEADPEDSDADDEFQVVPISQNTNLGFNEDASGPAKAFRAQEEKKSQESVLGRIFDVEQIPGKRLQQTKADRKAEADLKKDTATTPEEDFVSALKTVAAKLLNKVHGSTDICPSHLDLLDLLENAARAYVASEQSKKEAPKDADNGPAATDEQAAPENSTKSEDGSLLSLGGDDAAVPSLFVQDRSNKGPGKDTTPEDIDIEQPIDMDEGEDQIGSDSRESAQKEQASSEIVSTASSAPSVSMTPSSINATPPSEGKPLTTSETHKMLRFDSLLSKLVQIGEQRIRLSEKLQGMQTEHGNLDPASDARIKEAKTQLQDMDKRLIDIENQISTSKSGRTPEVDQKLQLYSNSDEARSRRISEYVRATRGLALESLAIHLIPVKASVLFRALDLRMLKRLTLLNVGPQAPIWTLLTKENAVQPLALRKVFTDNVSSSFLTCVSQLPELHELFILEHSSKHKPESFAPKTVVTGDQIRRTILKRHIHTIRKLMIKNEYGPAWDADEKMMTMICCRGAKLEELAVSMNIRAVHTFMQNLSGLANLRALNIIHFRNDDTCVWVMRETRKFIIDNLTHFPDLKLEWISIDDDRVERIVRPRDLPPRQPADRQGKRPAKAKAKAGAPAAAPPTTAPLPLSIFATGPPLFGGPPAAAAAAPAPAALPLLPVHGWDSESDIEEDDEDELGGQAKLETIEGVHFYDVWGVRIFKKEIMSGRL